MLSSSSCRLGSISSKHTTSSSSSSSSSSSKRSHITLLERLTGTQSTRNSNRNFKQQVAGHSDLGGGHAHMWQPDHTAWRTQQRLADSSPSATARVSCGAFVESHRGEKFNIIRACPGPCGAIASAVHAATCAASAADATARDALAAPHSISAFALRAPWEHAAQDSSDGGHAKARQVSAGTSA